MKKFLISTSALALVAPFAAHAQAAPAPATTDTPATQTDIIVTGTRTTGTRAADSAAPIQLVGSAAIQSVGQQDLTQVLAQSLPSLNFRAFGGDTANLTMSAALRGISPNDTLVLINGHRRHFTSNLSVLSGSPYTGSATVDLSFIPTTSIGHIEVLTDGAAAQYGSDAIAGVVNIIMKNADHGGSFTMTGGEYYKGDGETFSAAFNMGFKLPGDGFLNITQEYKYHDFSQRGTCDYRFFNPNCTVASTLRGNAAGQPYNTDIAGIELNKFYPRNNNIYGDSHYIVTNTFVNAGTHLSDSVEAYAFGNFSERRARSYENYRTASVASATDANGNLVNALPSGFNPLEALRETDFSVTGGLKGDLTGWKWDLSTTYGRDKSSLYTLDSANTGLYAEAQGLSTTPVLPQRNFYDGSLSNSEWTVDLDLSRDFDVGMAKPLTVSAGGEFRRGVYETRQGEPSSYLEGGPQSYPGFSPTDGGSNSRKVFAGYVDFAVDPVTNLHVDIAGRYEHYSEFGSVGSGKFNARYDFSPAFALRGTFSNGFRAPTLAEEYYSSVNVGPGTTFGQFPADSASSTALGFGRLKPEKSTNFSAGFVAHPVPRVQLTVDAYQIKITNRIVNTTAFATEGTGSGATPANPYNLNIVSPAVYNALAGRGVSLADASSYSGINIFTNGADTRTRGVEGTANYMSDFGSAGRVDWSLGANYNDTKVTNVRAVPAAVYVPGINYELLNTNGVDALSSASPRIKVIGNALYTWGKFSLNLRETLYGATSQWTSFDGTGDPGAAGRTLLHTAATGISDINVGYKMTPMIRFDFGANNLFNVKAPTVPNALHGVNDIRPSDGNKVYGEPIGTTPWGINGGYYYAKISLAF